MRNIQETAVALPLLPKNRQEETIPTNNTTKEIEILDASSPSEVVASLTVSACTIAETVVTNEDAVKKQAIVKKKLTDRQNSLLEIILNQPADTIWFARSDFDVRGMGFKSKSARDQAMHGLFKKLISMEVFIHNGEDRGKSRYAFNPEAVEELRTISSPTELIDLTETNIKTPKKKDPSTRTIKNSLDVLELRRKQATEGIQDPDKNSSEADQEKDDKEDQIEPIALDVEKFCETNPSANYIINGIDTTSSDVTRNNLRAAISQLTGSELLEDPVILERYLHANEIYTTIVMRDNESKGEMGVMRKVKERGEYSPEDVRLATVIKDLQTMLPSWRNYGNCNQLVGDDLFYPERGASTKEARAVCKECIVREECLEYALTNNEGFGIWGGKSHKERLKIRKARKQASFAIEASARDKVNQLEIGS